MGILVWQDFPFACGVYPAHDGFLQSVEAEARCNIMRIRHHPSLAILCGNNEDYQQVLQWSMQHFPRTSAIIDDPVIDLEHGLPAVVIYEKILPALVSELIDPAIPYVKGSPYGGEGWDTYDRTLGDIVSSENKALLLSRVTMSYAA